MSEAAYQPDAPPEPTRLEPYGKLYSHAMRAGLSAGAKALYAELVYMSGARGYCWGAVATLAEQLGVSIRSIHYYRGELERAGAIFVIRTGRGNEYHICKSQAHMDELRRRSEMKRSQREARCATRCTSDVQPSADLMCKKQHVDVQPQHPKLLGGNYKPLTTQTLIQRDTRYGFVYECGGCGQRGAACTCRRE